MRFIVQFLFNESEGFYFFRRTLEKIEAQGFHAMEMVGKEYKIQYEKFRGHLRALFKNILVLLLNGKNP